MEMYILFISLFIYPSIVYVKKINYVKEPVEMRINPINRPISLDLHLTARVKPSRIKVPAHLGVLRGQCFTKIIDDYRYSLCPFENVTQYEQTFKWNPYSGIIGIWKGWNIEGNEFKEMLMTEGDDCGSKRRQTRVKLVCSEDVSMDAHILSVLEPSTCEYLITVSTHLICFNHSLNVYPFLPPMFQERWDELEGRYQEEELTQKGYETSLRELLTDAEFLLSQSEEEKRWQTTPTTMITNEGVTSSIDAINGSSKMFTSLHECQENYSRLSKGMESLQQRLVTLDNSKTYKG